MSLSRDGSSHKSPESRLTSLTAQLALTRARLATLQQDGPKGIDPSSPDYEKIKRNREALMQKNIISLEHSLEQLQQELAMHSVTVLFAAPADEVPSEAPNAPTTLPALPPSAPALAITPTSETETHLANRDWYNQFEAKEVNPAIEALLAKKSVPHIEMAQQLANLVDKIVSYHITLTKEEDAVATNGIENILQYNTALRMATSGMNQILKKKNRLGMKPGYLSFALPVINYFVGTNPKLQLPGMVGEAFNHYMTLPVNLVSDPHPSKEFIIRSAVERDATLLFNRFIEAFGLGNVSFDNGTVNNALSFDRVKNLLKNRKLKNEKLIKKYETKQSLDKNPEVASATEKSSPQRSTSEPVTSDSPRSIVVDCTSESESPVIISAPHSRSTSISITSTASGSIASTTLIESVLTSLPPIAAVTPPASPKHKVLRSPSISPNEIATATQAPKNNAESKSTGERLFISSPQMKSTGGSEPNLLVTHDEPTQLPTPTQTYATAEMTPAAATRSFFQRHKKKILWGLGIGLVAGLSVATAGIASFVAFPVVVTVAAHIGITTTTQVLTLGGALVATTSLVGTSTGAIMGKHSDSHVVHKPAESVPTLPGVNKSSYTPNQRANTASIHRQSQMTVATDNAAPPTTQTETVPAEPVTTPALQPALTTAETPASETYQRIKKP